jgi:RNA polymerase sigma-70 factor (ECF subfamily)
VRRSIFRGLALSHLDLLYRAALRVTGSRERADDLVQETYRIAFERWRDLRDPAACRAWLLRILHNAHVDELRRRRRLVPIEGEALELCDPRGLADPGRSGLARLTLERLEEVLSRLPEETRWLLLLREGEGLSYAELAAVFSVPVGTIRSRLARLRARLLAEIAAGAAEHRTKGAHDG